MNSQQKSKFLFSKADGEKFSSEHISKLFKKYVRKAGLDDKYHFHCLRHTALTHLANSGLPTFMIKDIAGHTDIKTTQSYVHPSHDEMRNKLNEINYPWDNQ